MKKPEKIAPGRGGAAPEMRSGFDSAIVETSSPVEKHMVSATPAKHRKPFSSAFLQPEQFIAELKVASSADVRPELAFLASRRRSKSPENPRRLRRFEKDDAMVQPVLESFCEPANSVPKLELSYDGQPAPAPAHLRTRGSAPDIKLTAVTDAVGKNSGAGGSPGESTLVLQKSGSSGGSVKSASAGAHQMRVRSLRENPGMLEVEKPASGLRRMLHWGTPMEFFKSLGKKKKYGNGKREEARSRRTEPVALRDPEEDSCSPRSSASSVTSYSEVNSTSQCYEHANSRRNVASRVKSKPGMRRGIKEPGDDGIHESLRQRAVFRAASAGDASPGEEDDDAVGPLESRTSVAKHKRNSTWDAGNQLAPGNHMSSPKRPHRPRRDAHVLLAPPKRLTGDTEAKNVKSSRVMELSLPLPLPVQVTPPAPSPLPVESTVPSPPPVECTAPLPSPLPVETTAPSPPPPPSPSPATIESESFPPSPQLRPPPLPLSIPDIDTHPHQQPSHPSPCLSSSSAITPAVANPPTSRTDTPPEPRSQRLPAAQQQDLPKSLSRSHSAIARLGVKSPQGSIPSVASVPNTPSAPGLRGSPSREPLQGLAPVRPFSFEQVVAGRGRVPPTDNTLMKFFFKCREIEGLNQFLGVQKRRFLDASEAETEKCFHMIMSKAGAGLSSMISTICTAWLLENTMASATSRVWHPIPVMNMCQQDMWSHRDAAWLFHVCGIDANALLFRDEITPTNEAVISGRVKRAVMGEDVFVTKVDEVASSCTIVSEKFRQEAAKLLQARYMMTLLLAGILVDTNNLSSGSPRDKQQATILLVGAGSLGRNGFYNHLRNIRDKSYITTFIKDIYGESNALTGEKPTQLGGGIAAQSERTSTKRPASFIASKVVSEGSAHILPSHTPLVANGPLSGREDSPNSKNSLALHRGRRHSSVQ